VKKFASIVFISLIAVKGFCQLVNGSFELNSALPATLGAWSVVDGWVNPASSDGTPDYFHSQANSVADLPETPSAIVHPYDGNAVMGLVLSAKQGTNRREYIQTHFESPLVVGQEYFISFRITNGEITPTSLAGLAVNHIGLLFSTNAPVQIGNGFISATPQFVIDTVVFSSKWERVDFNFIADQPYENLTFGLFNGDDSHTISERRGNNPQVAYYFVDDFILSTEQIDDDPVTQNPDDNPVYTDPPNAPFFVPNAFTPNNDGDNDIFIPVAGTIKEWVLEIFTKWGDPVFSSKNSQRGWDGSLAAKPCASGSYIWKITYQVPDENGEVRTAVEFGFVNLVK